MPAADNPSREEMNAKLEAVEARLDGKLSGIAAKLDVMISGQSSLRDDMKDVRSDLKSNKAFVIGTGVALGALILGFFAYGAQILDLATALFAAGASK